MVSRGLKSYDSVDVLFGVNEKKFKSMLIVHVKLNDKKMVLISTEAFSETKNISESTHA